MATKKVTDLVELVVPASGDFLAIVDISDLSQGASGSLKKIKDVNLGSNAGASASEYGYLFATSTSMADPGTGLFRFNNASAASATAIAISALTNDDGNPNIDLLIATWDDSNSVVRGVLTIKKLSAPATFAVYNISGSITNNTTWLQLTVTYVTGNGSLSASDEVVISFARTGDTGNPPQQANIFMPAPANGTIPLISSARYAFTINGLFNLKTSAGTITAAIQINGTNVTGLSALSVTSTPQSPTATAANSVSIGDRVTLVLSSNSTAANLETTLKGTV